MGDANTALIRRLGECLQADEQLQAFVLFDPMLREPFPQDLIARFETVEIPVRHPSLKDAQRPRLATLNPHDPGLLNASADHAVYEQHDPDREASEGFTVGGWLLSRRGADQVARHLARVMGNCTVQGVGRKFVRLADRRVLELLWPDLDRTQRQALLGPVESWMVLNRRGDLSTFAVGETPEPESLLPEWSLRLRADQWARMDRCEIVQAMLRGWRRFVTELPPDYLVRAANAVTAGQHLGLSNQRDLTLLGAYQLQIHPRLCEHPRVIEVVEQALNQGTALFKALEMISDPDGWDDIRQQLGPMDMPQQTAAAYK